MAKQPSAPAVDPRRELEELNAKIAELAAKKQIIPDLNKRRDELQKQLAAGDFDRNPHAQEQ